jgi:CelD/BcsL family acetyltransferase involved in cellulose biosynthesis
VGILSLSRLQKGSSSSPVIDKREPTSDHGNSLRTVVCEDPAALAPHVAAWDTLAVRTNRPFCAPCWMLAWWQEARTGDARLQVVLLFAGSELVVVAPFFAQVAYGLVELRLLAAGFSHRIGILASDESLESEVTARTLAQALASIRPRAASIVFEGVDSADPWPNSIAGHWPGRKRPRQRTDATMDAPMIDLDASYETWMERRERHFRKEARRTGRRMEEEEVCCRVLSDRTAIEPLLRLHQARWEDRGGSNVHQAARATLERAADDLGSAERMWVALLECPSGPVAAELIVRAGDTAVFWGGGFDPAWARLAPGTQAMLFALRHLAEGGVRVADLGGGPHDYKRRLSDRDTAIVWRTLFLPSFRYPLIRLRLAPKHVKFALRGLIRRQAPQILERIRSTRSRLHKRTDRAA